MSLEEKTNDELKPTVLSGMRPTGRLHIGHIEGVLRKWLQLQEEYACKFFVADWHALTTNTESKEIRKNTYDMVRDWLAFGIDPKKSTIFVQSDVPQHAELHVALSMLNTVARLQRMPTFTEYVQIMKEEGHNRKKLEADQVSYGFLGYPLLQAADILVHKAKYVPVGDDQKPHIELCQELAKRFNATYGPIFPVPEILTSNAPRILGTDGRKMSKSYANTISPQDTGKTLSEKVAKMRIDPKRTSMQVAGNPDECSVYDLHRIYNQEKFAEVYYGCRQAILGCGECKQKLPPLMSTTYKEYRNRFDSISDKTIETVLREGGEKAREEASKTMEEVRKVMLLKYY
ncbi:MAG: tryptophan--tRNA ligase [Nanoarchaeota archaeon]